MPASVPAIPVPFLSNVMTETSAEIPAPNSENGEDSEIYLVPSPTMDFEYPAVRAFLETLEIGSDPRKNAVQLYYAVRDRIRYDPYTINLSVEGLKASTTVTAGRAWCISKAILLSALCRSVGIPARLGFADVRNHLSTERMRQLMKTDVFLWHGYSSILLEGRWIKATPAFNFELCQRFGLKSLEFNGSGDSLYHSFDLNGKRHMEYPAMHGEYEDVPIAEIDESFHMEYNMTSSWNLADFDQEVKNETRMD